MKKLLYGVGGLVALLVAAILVVPMFVDANAFKEEITARVKEATGRDLAIDGDIGVRFLVPATGISVSGVRFANLAGAVAADMITLEALEVNVALLPLLSGEIQVESIRLVEPVIELEVLQDGRANWLLGGAGGAGEAGDGEAGSGDEGGAVRIDDLVIVNGTLAYRDTGSGTLEFVEHLDARLSAGSLQGPFAIQGAAVVRNLPASFDVSIGRMAPGQKFPLKLALEVGEGSARLDFTGLLSEASAQGTLEGTLKASGPDLRDLMGHAGATLGGPPTLPSLLAQGFELETKLSATATAVNLNDINLVFGAARATGAVSASLETPMRIDTTLTLNRLDLDALLAAAAEGEATVPGDGPAPAAPGPAAGTFALPDAIEASLALNVDAVSYRGGVIRQAQAAVTLSEGRLHLTRAGALLPGGSDLQLVGALAAVDGQPEFDGAIEVTSDNLRGLLKWLEIDLGQVPADRLRKFSLSSKVRVTPELAQVHEVDLRLDTSRLTGAAAYAFRVRPSFSADIVLDRLNVDAYLPPTGAAEANPGASAGKEAGGAAALGPLAALELFDTNFKARIDKLVVNELQVSGFSVDLSLIGGVLTVRRAAFADLAGARGALSGVARGFRATPAFDVNLDLRARDLGQLMRAAGLTPAPEVASLGAAAVKGGVKGSLDDLDLDLDIAAAGGTVKLEGGLKEGMTAPRFDILLDARHPDLVALANGFGAGLKKGQGADGPLGIKGKVTGNLDAMKLDLAVAAAGARMKVAGSLAAAGAGAARAPRFDLALDIAHPSYVKLGGAFGVPLNPAPGGGDGPVKVAGKVAGTLEAMTMDLSVAAAGAAVKLVGSLAAASTALRLDIQLDASHPSLARLARTFDAGLKPAGNAKDGPVSVKGRVAGPLSLLQLDLSVAAAGATLKAAGSLAAVTVETTRYKLDIEAGHADVSGFARTIGIDYRPAAVNLGGLALRGHLTGGSRSASLDKLDGSFGPVKLKGILNIRWGGARPAISGVLNTSEIIVDLFLPLAATGQAGGATTRAPAAAGGARERWSREPIDITWLRAFDANLKLASRGIVFQGYEFREPKVTIKLINGGLDIDPLTGKLFDGDVNLKTWVRQTSPPSIGVGLKINNGDVLQALVRTARIDTVSGRFGFDGRFQSAGRSQLEMISALSGNGSFNVRDGFVKGFDLRALSDRLGRLNSLIDFTGLINTSMSGGQTRLISVDGNFQATRGVVTTNNTRTVLDGGRGTTVGTVDLPRWWMHIENRFSLPDHPKAPPFGVDLRGPLDAPRRDLKTGQLQQFVLARVSGTVIRKTLGEGGLGGVLGGVLGTLGGGQPQPGAPQPQPTQPQPAQQPSSPVDELIKGLGGLLGGGGN